MKFENLEDLKFKSLSEDAMKHIVGGRRVETSGDGKVSNDWGEQTSDTVYERHFPSGGDWSRTYLQKIGVEQWLQE